MPQHMTWRDLRIKQGAKLSDKLVHFLDRASNGEIHTFFVRPEKSKYLEPSLLSLFFLSRLKNRLVLFETLPKDDIIQAVDPNYPSSKRMLAKFRETTAEILKRARSIDTGEIVTYKIGHAAYHLKETNKVAFVKRRWWDFLAVSKDKKRQYKKLIEIAASATKDPLTGLPNRYELENDYKKILQSTQRRNHNKPEEAQEGMSVIIIDLDFFKKVNDVHGHQAGDTVLKSIGALLGNDLRSDDKVFRYGGEEFVILSSDVKSEANAKEFAEKIRRRLEENPIDLGNGVTLKVTGSIGVHYVQPNQKPETFQEAFEQADKAVYAAKHNGRNQVVTSSTLTPTPTSKEEPTPPAEKGKKLSSAITGHASMYTGGAKKTTLIAG